MGETFLRCPLRTSRGQVSVSLPPGGEFLLGTPELVSRASHQGFCIPIQEMVAVRLGTASDRKEVLESTEDENSFTVFFIQREKGEHWKLGVLEFIAPTTSQLATRWVCALQTWIHHHGVTRPKSLLVFINPVGGRKRAMEIYQNQVAPLFALAGIHAQVVETCHANEAHDYILQQDLCGFDGLVSVGGDGTFNEVMHALIDRTQQRAGNLKQDFDVEPLSPRLRIGIIPAGSTDCVCFATVGTNDPITSALHIIIGDSQPLDVCSVWHDGMLLRYSVSLVGYGFYGDVVSTSEKHRWMGPARYTFAGAKAVLSNRGYEGTIEFQLAASEDTNPQDQSRCRSGCMVCSESSKNLSGSKEENFSEFTKQAGGEWQQVHGSFLAVNLTCMSSACPKSPKGLSPCAHLADGTADLILVHKCSVFSFLQHLNRHTNCSDQFDLPFVSVYRVRAIRFTASKGEDWEGRQPAAQEQNMLCGGICQGELPVSCWTCDGETLSHTDIAIRVHRSLIHLFARGIEQQPSIS